MQASVRPAAPRPPAHGPVIATLIAVPVVAIVLAALAGASLPIVGSGRGALIVLWILGSAMCSLGIGAMRSRFGVGRASAVGLPLGLGATALIFSALLGWTAALDPIARFIGSAGQADALDRAAIVGVGGIMAVKWAVAWLSYLP
jgi:hypothetical protein